jgi:hypothetical protein
VEIDETIRLSTLRRAAVALNCSLYYVLVPDEPLEDAVLRQAHGRAVRELINSDSHPWDASDPSFEEENEGWLEARTLELVDHRGLWHPISPRDGS